VSILQDKVAVITGATSGIGQDAALLFAKSGAKVVLAGRRQAEGNHVAEKIRASGGDALFVPTDVSRNADVKALIDIAVATYGRVDIAFNNAGVEGNWIPIVDQPEEDWDYTVNINLKGVWLCLKYELRQMLRQGQGGSIVNMASVAGLMGSAGAATYSATKHGVIGLTKSAALESAGHGIRVNAVCPAVIETDMAERAFGGLHGNDPLRLMHPLGRFGKPMEVAEAVVWMCSDHASFMTGQSLVLDGGLLAGVRPQAQDESESAAAD
jgi:NAD(P)-dependent dehydrogenase (short-subunit alcohol dehydrogenase family)